MISNEGNDVNIWMPRSLTSGKIRCSRPRIGDTANPGKEITAEMDQMAIRVASEMVPFPVFILITFFLIRHKRCNSGAEPFVAWPAARPDSTAGGRFNDAIGCFKDYFFP